MQDCNDTTSLALYDVADELIALLALGCIDQSADQSLVGRQVQLTSS